MAAYNKFNDFVDQLGRGVHNFASHTIKCYLSNATPNAATHTVKGDIAEFAGGTGYTPGGASVTPVWSESAGTAQLAGTDIVWTAGAGDWNAFRYVILYNDTPSSPLDPLIAWWDYGSSLTLGNGETFTVDFGSSIFTLA